MKNDKRGFTLIELLVIIAILAILASLVRAPWLNRSDAVKAQTGESQLTLPNGN